MHVSGGDFLFFLKIFLKQFLSQKSMSSATDNFSNFIFLKEECKEYCINKYGIDPTNCSIEEKNKIRNTLVSHAKRKREETDGRYWISRIEKETLKSVFVIPQLYGRGRDVIFVCSSKHSFFFKTKLLTEAKSRS